MTGPSDAEIGQMRSLLNQANRVIRARRKAGQSVESLVAKRDQLKKMLAFAEPVGRVEVRRAKSTGTWVGLYRNSESGMESDPETPWSVVCEAHGCLVCVATREHGRLAMSAPHDWCPQCSGEGCGSCVGGHVKGCPLINAEDLGDCLAGSACVGCCPNACKSAGLAEMAGETGRRLRRMFGGA